ncbi:nucleoside hydrolase [Colwellia echini]|uniref:Nucleoside hydrolase n=1 Tax=Colwellia echini TaxID=1982103 RepID=A0ABY3N076_9GAMM|nr:nucleoside hydrolase [Colwellia echini]TYK66652.1 nucleoside hydrolase [Colwellia echini]
MKIFTTLTASIAASAAACVFSLGLQAKPVIFDNDMAIDDWAALLFLVQHPKLDVTAITISASGESHCQPGLTNTTALLELSPYSGKNIPVACGDAEPLDGYAVFPEAWRTDSDTLSGVPVKASERPTSNKHAVEVIHQAIVESNEPVTILATGPLTNIAQWLEKYPQDQKSVERLVIMGGNVNVKGNIIVPLFTKGHPNKTAEWNIFIDPVSADKVLASDLNIELVGLDVTNSVRVTSELAAEFSQNAKTPAALFWKKVLAKNDWFIDSGEYYFWDTLAALIVAEPELCQGSMAGFNVEKSTTTTPWLPTSDMSMSVTRWDGKPRQHLDSERAGTFIADDTRPEIKVCEKTKPSYIFNDFSVIMNRS